MLWKISRGVAICERNVIEHPLTFNTVELADLECFDEALYEFLNTLPERYTEIDEAEWNHWSVTPRSGL